MIDAILSLIVGVLIILHFYLEHQILKLQKWNETFKLDLSERIKEKNAKNNRRTNS